MHAVIEFALNFDSFINNDLANQGLYMIRTSIRDNSSGKYARPCTWTNFEQSKTTYKKPSAHEESHFVFSKGFQIRFFEKVVFLGESVYFRTEISYNRETVHSLVIDLLHSEDPDKTTYVPISSSELSIRFLSSFHHEYFPVIFNSSHSAMLEVYCYYLLVAYKFKSVSEPSLTTAEYFFREKEEIKTFFKDSEIDKIYIQMAQPLIEAYNRLKKCCLMIESYSNKNYKKKSSLEGIELSCFLTSVSSSGPIDICENLLDELGKISSQLLLLWNNFCDSTTKTPECLRLHLKNVYNTSLRFQISSGFISRFKQSKNLVTTSNDLDLESIKTTAKCKRLQNTARMSCKRSISEKSIIDLMAQPIIIEDVYLTNYSCIATRQKRTDNLKSTHLFIFVHGYKGSLEDMRLVRNQISLYNPNAYCLMSFANQKNTDQSIETQGEALAMEVIEYITRYFDTNLPDKISFLAHSLGGVIVRSALPFLKQYASKMHLFMSFGTPHLGMYHSRSKLVQTGIWLLKSIIDSPCLKQLRLEDDCQFLYKLSLYEGLDWFKFMVLLSSPQDFYVSQHSAQLEVRENEDKNVCEMAENILRNRQTVHRLTVDFKLRHKVFDSLIGRAAHVQVLEDPLVMKTILYQHPEFFL